MIIRSLRFAPAWAAFICLFLSACASADKNLAKETFAESQKSLAAGDYGKALDGFKEAAGANPRSRDLVANYIRTVEDIKQAADRARGRRDQARAAGIYRLLLDRFEDFAGFESKLTFSRVQVETALKSCRLALVDAQVRRAMRAGDPAKAAEAYQSALNDYPKDPDFTARCAATVRDIKALADKALGENDFAKAGRTGAILLKIHPMLVGLRPPLAFSEEDLKTSVAVCRDNLTKAGLEEYRKGNLAKAIAIWESLLAFDPDNAEIKKAVTTARTQLEAVNKKK